MSVKEYQRKSALNKGSDSDQNALQNFSTFNRNKSLHNDIDVPFLATEMISLISEYLKKNIIKLQASLVKMDKFYSGEFLKH